MPWCPKCKNEYEEHVEICVDCKIELVPNLNDYTYMKELIKVKKDDSEELLRYLEYSGVLHIESEEIEENLVVSVGAEEFEKALTYLKVYIHENMEEVNEEDYYFDEYETEIEDTTGKIDDMKSTIYTFGIVGIGIILVAMLNYFDILQIKAFNKVTLTLLLGGMGIMFLFIAIKTKNDMASVSEKSEDKDNIILDIVEWYKSKYDLDLFYKKNNIDVNEFDEGALYFAAYDIIKKEIRKHYNEVDEILINKAVEFIYDELSH